MRIDLEGGDCLEVTVEGGIIGLIAKEQFKTVGGGEFVSVALVLLTPSQADQLESELRRLRELRSIN